MHPGGSNAGIHAILAATDHRSLRCYKNGGTGTDDRKHRSGFTLLCRRVPSCNFGSATEEQLEDLYRVRRVFPGPLCFYRCRKEDGY